VDAEARARQAVLAEEEGRDLGTHPLELLAQRRADACVRIEDAPAERTQARGAAALHFDQWRAEKAGTVSQETPCRAIGKARGCRCLAQGCATRELCKQPHQGSATLAPEPLAGQPAGIQGDLRTCMQILTYSDEIAGSVTVFLAS